MQTLPEHFRATGVAFRVLARSGNVALLAKFPPRCRVPGYEVVILQRRPVEVIHGRAYPERETMPNAELWGLAGWTYTARPKAEVAFRALLARNAPGTGPVRPEESPAAIP